MDGGAYILFIMMVLWQMPHFFAIAIRRLDDYIAAEIPVLPAIKGIFLTKVHMVFYVVAFVLASTLLTVFGYTGYGYLIVALALGCIWIGLSFLGFRTQSDQKWARKMFTFSLINITVLCLMLVT
jgi:protoheme IX farnesyltransferase